MKNITVSDKTAVALKEAGFPQPKPQTGQFWYSPNGNLFFMNADSFGNRNIQEVGRNNFSIGENWGKWVFAPQSHDILEQMGWEYYLLFEQTRQQWFCNKPNDETGIWCDKNPHEAAAKAYLFQKNVT